MAISKQKFNKLTKRKEYFIADIIRYENLIKSAKNDRVRVEIDIIDAGFYSITVSQLRDKLNEVIKEHGCDCTLGIRKWEDDDSGTLYAEHIREQTDKEFQKND